jgi:hypothetical protein
MGISSARSGGIGGENNAAAITGLTYLRSSSEYFRSKQKGMAAQNNIGKVYPSPYRPSGQNYTLYLNNDGKIRCMIGALTVGGPSTTNNLPFTSSPAGAQASGNTHYAHNAASDCGRNPMHWDGCWSSANVSVNAAGNTAHWSMNARSAGSPQWGWGYSHVDYTVAEGGPTT